jgi:hypothetical protein
MAPLVTAYQVHLADRFAWFCVRPSWPGSVCKSNKAEPELPVLQRLWLLWRLADLSWSWAIAQLLRQRLQLAVHLQPELFDGVEVREKLRMEYRRLAVPEL